MYIHTQYTYMNNMHATYMHICIFHVRMSIKDACTCARHVRIYMHCSVHGEVAVTMLPQLTQTPLLLTQSSHEALCTHMNTHTHTHTYIRYIRIDR